MKIEIDVQPTHWWIERLGRYDRIGKNSLARAMVRFKGKRDEKEYEHEEHLEGTPEECLAFVRKYFPEGEK